MTIVVPDPQLSVDGRRWLWPDGTVLPVIRGGATGDGSGGSGDGNNSGGAGEGGSGDRGTGDGSGSSDGSGGGDGKDGKGTGETGDKTFTQADIDAIVTKRLAKAEKDWKAQVEQAAERAKMDEAERLKAEKADADKATAEAKREALSARVEVTGERLALAAKVDPDKAARFVEIAKITADLDAVTTDDGKPDEQAIKAAVDKTLKDWPEFKATKVSGDGGGASGGEMNGHGGEGRRKTLSEAVAAKINS